MGQNTFLKGLTLVTPFVLLLLAMSFFGGSTSEFLLESFSGFKAYRHGPYTILTSEQSPAPDWAKDTLEQFTTQMVRNYGGRLSIQNPDPNTSGIKVYLLSSAEELETFGLQRMNRDLAHNGGYFLPTKREIAIVLSGNRDLDNQGLRHEMLHALMYLSRPETIWPRWFSEGMATFFEASRSDKNGWHPGGQPEERPAAGNTLPIKTILEARGTDFTSEDNRSFYHSARMLTEFLFVKRTNEFFQYYESLRTNEGESSFPKIFGDISTLEREWKTYLENRK